MVAVKFAQTGATTMRIGGIYKPNPLIGSYVVGDGFFLVALQRPAADRRAARDRTPAPAISRPALNRALTPYPNVAYKTRAQFEKPQQAKINQELGLVYVLLALAVLVALIGIVNTLMLSVFERTREIGLLRAVGMKRRQVRAMIRSEAVIIALFGAVVGIVIGTGLGIALASSLRRSGVTEHRDPGPQPDRVRGPRPACSVWPPRAGRPGARRTSTSSPRSLPSGRLGQIALDGRRDPRDHVLGRQRRQRLEPQDIAAEDESEHLAADQRGAFARVLIAEGGDRRDDQLVERGLHLRGDGLVRDRRAHHEHERLVGGGSIPSDRRNGGRGARRAGVPGPSAGREDAGPSSTPP